MSRGGRRADRTGPERRCIATGESGPRERLIRFVLGPGETVVPDLAAKLPGRGVWLTADRALVEKAVRRRLFARAFRRPVTVPEDLPGTLERLLAGRLVEILALGRKAGQAVAGFEKVRAMLGSGAAGMLMEALDGAPDGRLKLRRLARDLPRITVLRGDELGLAFGRDFAIHAALARGGIADRALAEARRLGGFRPEAEIEDGMPERARAGTEGSDGDTGPDGPRTG